MATLHCRIVTPAAAVLDTEASYISFQAFDGQQGVMTGASPFLSQLGCGVCRVDTSSGSSSFVLSGGFAQMSQNSLVLLADSTEAIDSIDANDAQRKLAEANARATATPQTPTTLAQREDIEKAQSLARARIAAARRT
ncbi:MAG: F0F1 ATP synthase subunit epsilon [Phycisphaerales bacterium]|nr:F0F1 ATP synthase subunit epsilon [Phycisphaerales bacterium]